MDWVKIKAMVVKVIVKYKYPLMILCFGIALILLPIRNRSSNTQQQEVIISSPQNILDVEERLSSVLSSISGAGDVKVLLTLSEGEETIYQSDEQMGSGGGNGRTDTVTITDSDRNEQGLVRQINPAKYMGAIIVCDGADDPSVRLAIVNAVSNATGLGADKITVLKMK